MCRLLAVLLLVSGCDVVFGIDERNDAGGGGRPDAAVHCAGTSALRSEFTDEIDFARGWDRDLDTNTTIEVVDRMLAVTVDVEGYATALTNRAYDFSYAAAQVRVVEHLPYDHAEVYVSVIETATQNYCYVSVDDEDANRPSCRWCARSRGWRPLAGRWPTMRSRIATSASRTNDRAA